MANTTIHIGNYNMFDMDVDAIVNPCNVLGVAGAGLSAIFKKEYPDNHKEYCQACKDGALVRGVVHYTVNPERDYPIIFNFPSKPDYKVNSTLSDIYDAMMNFLDKIEHCIQYYGLKAICIPALGSGLGGLNFNAVLQILIAHFNTYKFSSDLDVYICNPK